MEFKKSTENRFKRAFDDQNIELCGGDHDQPKDDSSSFGHNNRDSEIDKTKLIQYPEFQFSPYLGTVKKKYLHHLKIWHFLDSQSSVSHITGATITQDRRIVFADNANGSLKAYGLKVSKHFLLIRRRVCRRSYINLTSAVTEGLRRFHPFDLCEYEANKVVVTTGAEKHLLFVDLDDKKVISIKSVDFDFFGIIFYREKLVTVSTQTKSVSFLDVNGNVIQTIRLQPHVRKPVYLSYISRNDTLIISDEGNWDLWFIRLFSSLAMHDSPEMVSINIESLSNKSGDQCAFQSPKGVASESRYIKPVSFVCDNELKAIRRLQYTRENCYTELSPIMVGKKIQCIIFDDILDELYICPENSNHALIWKGGGIRVKMEISAQLPFTKSGSLSLKPKLMRLEMDFTVSDREKLNLSSVIITPEHTLVISFFNDCRLLIYDLGFENIPRSSQMSLEHFNPRDLCRYDSNKLTITTVSNCVLLFIDIKKKLIEKIIKTTGHYDKIIFHKETFIVHECTDNVLCFLNMNGEELQRMIIPGLGNENYIAHFDDTLFVSDGFYDRVLCILPHEYSVHVLKPMSTKFYEPRGMVTDDRGVIYVCDSGNQSIRRFVLATKEELQCILLGFGMEHIAYDKKSDRLYVADWDDNIFWFQADSML